ncbi:MAG TPA: response regulator [Caldilineaceae bacterium]|nr:response regulator [Caldilineaceae bacterium]
MSTTILVVDRDPVFCLCLKASLQEAGFGVYLASSGQELLAILAKIAIDLVIVDARFMETISLIRCSTSPTSCDLPIVLLASSKSPEDMVAAYVAGADAYIAKPFSFSEVTACIQKQLQAASLRRRSLALIHSDSIRKLPYPTALPENPREPTPNLRMSS